MLGLWPQLQSSLLQKQRWLWLGGRSSNCSQPEIGWGATGSRSGGTESVSVVSKSESFSSACRGSKVGRWSATESYKEV